MRSVLYNIYALIFHLKNGINYFTILKIFNELKLSQYWDEEKLKQFQLNTLNELLIKAKSAPFYVKTLIHMRLPSISLELFNKESPVLIKREVISNSKEIATDHYTNRYKHTTSGSSGDPMTVFISAKAQMYRQASVMRFLNWWGVKKWDKSVLIWGLKASQNKKGVKDYIKSKLRNRLDINVMSLNMESFLTYFDAIEKYKPLYIRGYKSGLLQFAELMDHFDKSFIDTKLKVAIVTSEVLLNDERVYIEKSFQCKVANEYGSAEAGLYANECPEGSMHINEESVFLTEKIGLVHVTELFNDSMPLINYMNEDSIVVSPNRCKCGRTSRVIEKVEGRINDYVIRQDGSKLSQYFFYYLIKELDDEGYSNSIIKYKVVQTGMRFKFYIEDGLNYNSGCEKYIKNRMCNEIGKSITIEFEKVESIPREKSGKLRFFKRER